MNRREFIKNSISGIIIVNIPFISCSKNPVSSGLDIVDSDSRIVPGKSIDNVNLGDTKALVEEVLGTPDHTAHWDGLHAGGIAYEYDKAPYEGLTVSFSDDKVYMLWIIPPYNGTTKDGIGIGSSLELLHSVYGTPHETFPSIKDEIYNFKDKREFRISYEEDHINQISISFVN